jgi:hypothetical protein
MKYFGYTIDTTKVVESVNPDKIKITDFYKERYKKQLFRNLY